MVPEFRGMLLAAGLGTRLRPLTNFLAKPAVPLLNRPLALYSLDLFRTAGIRRIAVNLHHNPASVRNALSGQPESILYSYEDPILGTAGGIGKVRSFFKGHNIVVTNGKIYFEEDLSRVIQQHRETGAAVTLVLVPVTADNSFNPVLLDNHQNIVGFSRSFRHSNDDLDLKEASGRGVQPYVFTGIHVLDEEVLDFIPDGPCDTVMDVYPRLMTQGYPVKGFISGSFWREFSTPGRYLRSSMEILQRKNLSVSSLSTLPASCRNVIAGANVSVSENSKIEDTILWNDVSIAPSCSVRNAIVVGSVRLPKNTSVENAIVTPSDADSRSHVREPAKVVDGNLFWPLNSG